MSALYLRSRINCCCAVRLHGQHASYHHRVTQGGSNTRLTLSMRRMEARLRNASALWLRFSQSLASRRQRCRVASHNSVTGCLTKNVTGGQT
jgi:hypothetical protein